MNFKLEIVLLLCIVTTITFAQDKAEKKKLKQSQKYAALASQEAQEGNFAQAEALYRKAIDKNPDAEKATYNFGNLYFENNKKNNSALRYLESAKNTNSKSVKHKNYHNLGNLFMAEKDYQKAVEAYKNALRNNPTDEETRYNLALAKQKREKQKNNNKKKDNKKEKNKDNKNQKKDEKKEQGDKGNKEKKDQEQPKSKEGKKNQENKQKNKDANKDSKQGEKEKQQQPSQPKPQKAKMSKQQAENLLMAIENKEKNTQDKLNVKKIKGIKVQTEKDW